MSYIKQTLKKAREKINEKDYEAAEKLASDVLEYESSNYTACVFKGLSHLNLGHLPEAQKAYEKAVELQPENRLGWQGILEVYEKVHYIDEYTRAATKLAQIFQADDDRDRTLGVVRAMVKYVKANGNPDQILEVLKLQLPDGPFGDYLEGLLPSAERVYLSMAEIVERKQKHWIDAQVKSRRTRLGVKLSDVQAEVKQEVLPTSPLESIYENIIQCSPHEETRREYEAKLLQHMYDVLLVLPAARKLEQKNKVHKMAKEIVIIKSPVLLAYQIVLEWHDCSLLNDLDFGTIRDFLDFFPNHGLSKCLRAYLYSDISAFNVDELSNEQEVFQDGSNDPLDGLVDAVQSIPEVPLVHRILAYYHLAHREYELAVEVASNGLDAMNTLTKSTSHTLPKSHDAISLTLALAYVYYQSPKHHQKAELIFDGILEHDSSNVACLIGRGIIYQEKGEFLQSHEALRKANESAPNDREAELEYAWSLVLLQQYENGRQALESAFEKLVGEDSYTIELKAKTLWRIGQCIWDAEPEKRADRAGAYAKFIAALQIDSNLAPAFTSLGIFYVDYANDDSRARKCFQKAFELDAGEVIAAERLAREFADLQEWELVEIVARRVAEANKKRSTIGTELTWPQRTLGVVELNAQNYFEAIQHFQTSLRSNPEEFYSWMGLGEAYLNTGKYIAATKAFQRAQEIDPSNWFVKFLLGSVERDVHEHEKACATFRQVLTIRPGEFSVLIALADTLVSGAYHWLRKGYYSRAFQYAVDALHPLREVVATRPETFNVWKLLGDSSSLFVSLQRFASSYPFDLLEELLQTPLGLDKLLHDQSIDHIDGVTMDALNDADGLEKCLYGAVLAHKKAVTTSAGDRPLHASAWYNLGWAEFKCYSKLKSRPEHHRSAAIICFKRAIKLEPRNVEFWNALGCATMLVDPRVSQHCFVRALNIVEQNAPCWCNLGALYLLNHDYQLANDAFSRSQSVDPEYVMAWIGQGYVANIIGHQQEARELFEHAASISDDGPSLPKQEAAVAFFDGLRNPHIRATVSPLYLLDKLLAQEPDNFLAWQLRGFFLERIGKFGDAVDHIQRLCQRLEDRYEESEDAQDLVRFASTKSDLARNLLAQFKYEDALLNADEALDLLEPCAENKVTRLSAQLTAGMAAYFLRDFEKAIGLFRDALEESGEDANIIDLLSQVLWAKHDDANAQEVARAQLISNMERNPTHLGSLVLLGVIALADGDMEFLKTHILVPLHHFDPHLLQTLDTKGNLHQLLALVSTRQGKGAMVAWQRAIFTNPGDPTLWNSFAEAQENMDLCRMALQVAKHRKVTATELSSALERQCILSETQKAIAVAPWREAAWHGLAACLAK